MWQSLTSLKNTEFFNLTQKAEGNMDSNTKDSFR